MNTQTHILLACVVLVPAANAFARPAVVATDPVKAKHGPGLLMLSAVLGALAPDASLFFMWGLSKWQGVPESVVWQQWYFSDYWQQIAAVSNSMPVFVLMLIIAWLLGTRFSTTTYRVTSAPVRLTLDTPKVAAFLCVFSLAALLHTATDLPLHHDDGRPHFWPFSQWVFRSPVSYWDPNHYGTLWSAIELVLAMALIVILWKRYVHALAKFVLSVAGLSYLIVTGYWWFAF